MQCHRLSWEIGYLRLSNHLKPFLPGVVQYSWRIPATCLTVRLSNEDWAVLKRSFISQGRKELLTPPLAHHLRVHSASLRVEIPVFCLRASFRWLTHLRVLLTRTFLWPPPFLLHTGGLYGVAQLSTTIVVFRRWQQDLRLENGQGIDAKLCWHIFATLWWIFSSVSGTMNLLHQS